MLISLVAVAMGWGLSEYGKFWEEKRQDKKKLKRLLFFLLELRFQMTRDLAAEKEITKYLAQVRTELGKDFEAIPDLEFNQLKLLLSDVLKNAFPIADVDGRIEYLEKNIDQTILELAEVYPVFAYELNGQYNIKERQSKFNKYFDEVEHLIKEAPFDIQEWLQPIVNEDMFTNFDENLIKIAEKISKQMKNEVTIKLDIQDGYTIDMDMHKLLNELISKIKGSV